MHRTSPLVFAPVVVAACSAASAPPPAPPPTPTPHVIVTWSGTTPIGRERYRDDGRVLTSEITLGGESRVVSIERAPRALRVRAGGQETTREIPPDTVVLENGSWQAYALAAEWFADATGTPRPVRVLVPSRGAEVPGTILVTPREDGGRTVQVTLGGIAVTATLSSEGDVTRAEVPAQSIEALPEGVTPAVTRRDPPPGVAEYTWEIARGSLVLRGALWRPAGATGRVPVLLLVAGSGPTDRDGNNRLGVRSDAYRMLAAALAERGIATVRFDKRGVGLSGIDFNVAALTLDDLVADAMAFVEYARTQGDLGPITVAGHSEGGLIALEIARRIPVDALELLAAPGRPLGVIVREQLARQMDANALREVDRIFAAIRAGTNPDPVPEPLQPLFNPTVRAYLRSEIDVDPVQLLRGVSARTSVVQGAMDAQVTVGDAQALAAARPGVALTVLPHANHLFKDESSPALPQASYTDPTRPLSAGFVDAVLAGIAR